MIFGVMASVCVALYQDDPQNILTISTYPLILRLFDLFLCSKANIIFRMLIKVMKKRSNNNDTHFETVSLQLVKIRPTMSFIYLIIIFLFFATSRESNNL